MGLGSPGKIVKIDDYEKKLATVDVRGVRRQIDVACTVGESHAIDECVRDWVLVHVGFARNRIDDREAAETLKILIERGDAQAEIEVMRLSAAP